jgi:preprotein translocase subunit YajC
MPQSPQANSIVSFIPLILIFVIFYFLLIRPQRQKEKEHLKMLGNIQKNDEVVTSGGVHGTIAQVKEKTFILRIDDNVKIEIEKSSIAYVKKAQGINPAA